jgi:hypothetical protein
LSADVLSSKILRVKAKNAQIEIEAYRKNITNKEELVEIDKFKRHLDNVLGEGLYGGKILSKIELEDWAIFLKNKFGTTLEKVESFENPRVLAQFDASSNTIRYKDEVTEYFMAHESFHAEEMKLIGFNEYVKGAPLRGAKEADYTVEN